MKIRRLRTFVGILMYSLTFAGCAQHGQQMVPQTLLSKPNNGTLSSTVNGCNASTTANFNGNAIAAGSTIWFSAVMKVQGIGGSPVTLKVNNSTITFNANGTPYTISVPSASINIDPAATTATLTSSGGSWSETVPYPFSGNVLLDSVAFPVASDLPGGIQNVTWSGNFTSSDKGITIQWAWSAAVYSQFSSDYNALHVKPVDANNTSQYKNSDHAGTPESYVADVTGGATGGGGSNYTGSLSGTSRVDACLIPQNVYVVNSSGQPSDAFTELLAPSWTPNVIDQGFYGYGIALDSNGNAWIGRNDNTVIEFQATNGVLPSSPTMYYTGGFNQVQGIAVDKSNDIYAVNYVYQGCGYVSELLAVNGVVPANAQIIQLSAPGSCLSLPEHIAVDSNGNVFVGDVGNNRIAELVAVNGSVPPNSTFVQAGPSFAKPYGVAVDKYNDVYVAENDGVDNPPTESIKEMLAVNGTLPASPTILTLGGGIGDTAAQRGPWDVKVDNSGDVFVADYRGGVELIPPGCMSASCTTTISTMDYTTGIAVH